MPEYKFKKDFLRTPKGTRDILPHDFLYWQFVQQKAEEIGRAYGFQPIRTPHIEKTELFTATLGESSDVVEKQMYTFRTRGGDSLVLRPEGTIPIIRAYFEHGMHTWPQPVMLYYSGSFFRHESPQRGRFREFGQFGCEIIGEEAGIADALVIWVISLIFQEIGIKSYLVHVNTLGDKECRPEYRRDLVAYYRRKVNSLCKDCHRRLKTNPLRLLDCKNPNCIDLKAEAPQMVNYACSSCKAHFKTVLEFLDELGIPYYLNPYLVRGLDYYSRTVFEFFRGDKNPSSLGESKGEDQNTDKKDLALASGGRYDYLAEALGEKMVAGVGGSIGLDRVVEELRAQKAKPFKEKAPSIFLIQLGPQAQRKSFLLFEDLRKAKFNIAQPFSKDGLRSQLQLADKRGATWVLIVGQKEALDAKIIVRDMASGAQETILQNKLLDYLKKKISTRGGSALGGKK
ncbi:histidine--tRNA ligase [Patescibacteria group bacterium]|nr:histidine--tRNA ligase [Patescibacteria group bacterium]